MTDNLQLLRLAKEGDITARDRLITENMGLVEHDGKGGMIEEFSGKLLVQQIGLIGLIKAVDRFDLEYDVMLSTYSVPLIQGEIRRFLRDDGLVRVSRNLKTIHYRAEKYRQEYQRTNGREPTVDEICAKIGSDPEELVMAMESAVDISNIEEMGELQTSRREQTG